MFSIMRKTPQKKLFSSFTLQVYTLFSSKISITKKTGKTLFFLSVLYFKKNTLYNVVVYFYADAAVKIINHPAQFY